MGGSGGFIQGLVELARNSTWLETLQPYSRDIIQNYLMRGRDIKNPQHIKTCAKSLAKKITVFQILTVTIAEKNEKVDHQKTFSEFVCTFYFNLLNLVLTSGQFRTDVLSLWEESMLNLFSVFKVCFPNNKHVSEIFAKVVVDEYFSGVSLGFKAYAVETLKEYFDAFASSAEESNVNVDICYKAEDDLVTKDSPASVDVVQKVAATPTPSIPNKGAIKSSSSQIIDSGEADIDKLIGNLNLNQFSNQVETVRNDSDNPLKHTPQEWREILKHDIRRQLGMVIKPSSEGLMNLFYGSKKF